jgi:hypothetical protein
MATVKKVLKAVDKSKKPGLAKLPTAVRNKMSYAQSGKTLPSAPPKKTGMDAIKDLGKYVSTFGLAKEKYNPAPSKEATKKLPKDKMKAGGMLKRADGSYSKRGLWDNIRAAKGSGKKPTAAMLKQERKIKSKTKK